MYLLAEDMAANMIRRGLDPALAGETSSIVSWVVIDFLYGMTIVFTYAAIRPRFGPGPGTAAVAALIPWFAICSVMFGLAMIGYWPMTFWWKNAIFSVVVAIAAGLAGGAVYQEEPAQVDRTAGLM
jgi:hypothetical protein